ncbi:MAG: hypothetical protein ACI4TU_08430 [Candidatus Cryptobacteroides sp.]
MSLVETDKLIRLITDLDELLSSWNVMASDAYNHTLDLRTENLVVRKLADKETSRTTDMEESDKIAVGKSTRESEDLLEDSKYLHTLTEPLPEEAFQRVKYGREACRISQQDAYKAADWYREAVLELKRAEEEHEIALILYNNQQERYEEAVARFNATPEKIAVHHTDSNGDSYTTYEHNPEWDRAKEDMECQKTELDRCLRVLEEKKMNLDMAHEQYQYSEKACILSNDMLKESKQLLEKAHDLQEWSNNANKSALYAIHSAESALKTDKKAEEQNDIQHEINDDNLKLLDKVDSALEETEAAVSKVLELTESCNGQNIQFLIKLEGKATVLNKLSTIVPDDIQAFKI